MERFQVHPHCGKTTPVVPPTVQQKQSERAQPRPCVPSKAGRSHKRSPSLYWVPRTVLDTGTQQAQVIHMVSEFLEVRFNPVICYSKSPGGKKQEYPGPIPPPPGQLSQKIRICSFLKLPDNSNMQSEGDKKISNYGAFLALVCLRKYRENLGKLPKSSGDGCGGGGRRFRVCFLEEMTGDPEGSMARWRLRPYSALISWWGRAARDELEATARPPMAQGT